MKTIVLFFTVCLGNNSFGQSSSDRLLLDSAITPGIIMCMVPLSTIGLKKEEMFSYKIDLQEFKEKVDTSVILEIISNSKHLDTSNWTNQEVPKVILIKNRVDNIPLKAVKGLAWKHSLRVEVKKFNKLHPKKRNISYYSRPVFDNSKLYAAVAHEGKFGFSTAIYHKVKDRWIEIGVLNMGAY